MEKHWSSVVSRSVCDYFFEAQSKATSAADLPPVISTPHYHLVSIFRNHLYFVAVLQSEGTCVCVVAGWVVRYNYIFLLYISPMLSPSFSVSLCLALSSLLLSLSFLLPLSSLVLPLSISRTLSSLSYSLSLPLPLPLLQCCPGLPCQFLGIPHVPVVAICYPI